MKIAIALLAAILVVENTALAAPTQKTVFGSNRKLAMRESAELRAATTNAISSDAKAKISADQIAAETSSATFGSKRKLAMRSANITREEAPALSAEARAKLDLDQQTEKGTAKFGSNRKLSQRVNAINK